MRINFLALILCLALPVRIFSQDTLTVMYYNLLKFPNVNAARISYLETVVQYIKPDILVVCELTSGSGVSTILNSAMNTNGTTYYANAVYTDGPDTENMLFYNTQKLGLLGQTIIPTSVRDIDEYRLYYKNPSLTASSDTAYLYVYGLHLKAGSTVSDEAERSSQASVLKSYLLTRSFSENTIIGGDHNIYYSTEEAYTYLTASSQANLYDVIGAGSYHANSAYAAHFTQSTRTESFDGGATGGMDDRFDMILFSDDVLNGSNGVHYVPGTYRAIGQDGQRMNQSLVSPPNTSEPTDVINALYFMSDHLPVMMKIAVGGTVGQEELNSHDLRIYPNPAKDKVFVTSKNPISGIEIRDLTGMLVDHDAVQTPEGIALSIEKLSSGPYFIYVTSETGTFVERFIRE